MDHPNFELVFPGQIVINEENGSGLNGTVDWNGTTTISSDVYLKCEFQEFSSSSSSSSSSLDCYFPYCFGNETDCYPFSGWYIYSGVTVYNSDNGKLYLTLSELLIVSPE